MYKTFPGFDNEKSQNYIFDENIINKFNEGNIIFQLKSQLGNDANRLDSDLKWMKNQSL